MSILDTIDQIDEMIGAALADLPSVRADAIGLDNRAGRVYVDVDEELIIADHNNIRALEYYGGFEYVDRDAVTKIGDYAIYQSDGGDDRVGNAVSFFVENNPED